METKLKDNSISNDIKEIGKDGDIVLVVGCNERKLQVHSLFLKTASKVFRAILGPHFSEGQDLSSDNPKEIFLSEDDADAVQTICEVIHLRHDAASQILTGAQILQIAITADIYDCNDALKNASGYWLKHNGTDAEELKYFMAASYLFDDAQAFKETTAALILHHVSSYITLVKGDIEAILPWRIFCLLEEQRERKRLILMELLYDPMTAHFVRPVGLSPTRMFGRYLERNGRWKRQC